MAHRIDILLLRAPSKPDGEEGEDTAEPEAAGDEEEDKDIDDADADADAQADAEVAVAAGTEGDEETTGEPAAETGTEQEDEEQAEAAAGEETQPAPDEGVTLFHIFTFSRPLYVREDRKLWSWFLSFKVSAPKEH